MLVRGLRWRRQKRCIERYKLHHIYSVDWYCTANVYDDADFASRNRAGQNRLTVCLVTDGLLGYGIASGGIVLPGSTPATNYSSLRAIEVWWATRTDLQALVTGGRLWHRSAPENASVEPYLTYFRVSEDITTWTTGYGYYESVFQFNVHHSLPGLAESIAFQIADAMNTIKSGEIPLQIRGSQAIHVLPGSFGVEEGEGLGYGGRDCWICHFDVTIPWVN